MKKNYQKTLLACYLAFITQAICANFAPLLFLKFHTDYAISLGQIALIPSDPILVMTSEPWKGLTLTSARGRSPK